jgi:hypothetical protein
MFQVVVQSVMRRLKSAQRALPPPDGARPASGKDRSGTILVLVLLFALLAAVLLLR